MASSVHTWCLNPEPVDQKITMNQKIDQKNHEPKLRVNVQQNLHRLKVYIMRLKLPACSRPMYYDGHHSTRFV